MTTPEERARERIDKKLAESGWIVRSLDDVNSPADSGVIVREYPLTSAQGYADHIASHRWEPVGFACHNSHNRHDRTLTWTEEMPEGRWRAYTDDEIIARDKASLDIFWLRDESLEDSANLPDPDILAAEIIQDLQSALEELQAITDDLANAPGAEGGEDA